MITISTSQLILDVALGLIVAILGMIATYMQGKVIGLRAGGKIYRPVVDDLVKELKNAFRLLYKHGIIDELPHMQVIEKIDHIDKNTGEIWFKIKDNLKEDKKDD